MLNGQELKIPDNVLYVARKMRQSPTSAESFLWNFLRNRQLQNAKFKRQYPFKPYIADFYCHDFKLIVELDGAYHCDALVKSRDLERDAYFHSLGIKVLRFDNNDVFNNLELVLATISNSLSIVA
jgi:very-short-patch-repair endonuclease